MSEIFSDVSSFPKHIWTLSLVHVCRQNRELVYRQSSAIVHRQVGNKSLFLQLLPIDINHKSISSTTDGKLETCSATFLSVKLI